MQNGNKTIWEQKERGSILIFAVLMLSVILTITLTLALIFAPKLRSISETASSVKAIYAADSALEWCLYKNRFPIATEAQPTMANGATYSILDAGGAPSDCTAQPLNYRTVGSYGGVNRSFEITEL